MRKKMPYFLFITILLSIITSIQEGQAQGKPVPFEKGDRWGYMDATSKVVIKPQFIIAHEFSPEGIAAVVDEKGWVYINPKGDAVIRPLSRKAL